MIYATTKWPSTPNNPPLSMFVQQVHINLQSSHSIPPTIADKIAFGWSDIYSSSLILLHLCLAREGCLWLFIGISICMGVVIALSPGPGRFLSVATSVLSMDHRQGIWDRHGNGRERDTLCILHIVLPSHTTTPCSSILVVVVVVVILLVMVGVFHVL